MVSAVDGWVRGSARAAHEGRRGRPRRTCGRNGGLLVVVALVSGVVASFAVHAPPAQAVPAAAVTWNPVITVSKTTGIDLDGETLTVSGAGFDPLAHEGTRPPLAGQPSGFYVVFGRFGDPWRPSSGAPSSARQVITQKWALPAASRARLDPSGTSTDIITIGEDGTFSTTIDAKTTDGTGSYAIATYPGSGAVDAAQETLTPVSFAAPPVDTGSGTGRGSGGGGQSLVVTPVADLDPEGQNVRVKGTGFDAAIGVYVALCVDNGTSAAPSPCVGGADQSGTNTSAAWISSNPPPYAVGLTTPFGPGGAFDVVLEVQAKDEFVDCYEATTTCVLATRADHTASANRSADVKVPVYFTGQVPPVDPGLEREPEPTVTLGSAEVAQGGTFAVQGTGFIAGEQVQVWLHSSPKVILVVDASTTGTIAATATIPADAEVGVHHIELVGITSGRRVASADFSVIAAAVADTAVITSTTTSSPPTAALSAGPAWVATATLPATGSDGAAPLAGSGVALVAAGALLVVGARRQRARVVATPAPAAAPRLAPCTRIPRIDCTADRTADPSTTPGTPVLSITTKNQDRHELR